MKSDYFVHNERARKWMQDEIEIAVSILKNSGISFSEGRVPFTYHHDWLRNQELDIHDRAEAARYLTETSRDEYDYFHRAMRGTLYYLMYYRGTEVEEALKNHVDFRVFVSRILFNHF